MLDGLLGQLEHVPAGPGSGVPLIAVVSGTAGVGKTTLAVHWAHAAAERCPDGQLYANLRGFGPQVAAEPAEVLRGFLEALGVAGERVPAALDERAALYRSLLTGRRMLVVLDNARDAGQVRPLLPGTGPAVVLITSRNRLSGLAVTATAQLLSLQVMTTDDAAELLALRLGRRRVGAEPEAVATVISRCARLPLALAIAAARAASEPDQPLTALAAELRGTEDVLGVLGVDDGAADLRTVFSWSYRTINPAAARLFRLLAVHPGPDFTVPAAASLAAITRAEAHDRLVELVRASLISEHTPGRYQSHDLLRSYATELARRTDTDEARRSALARTLGHYLHSAHAANVLLGPQLIDPPDLPAPPDATAPEEPPDYDRAWAWLCAEQDVLLAATRLSAAAGFDRHTWHLTSTLETFLQRLGRWQEQAEICELALTATRRLGDQAALAAALRMSSRLYARLGQWDHAYSLAQEGLHLYEQLQDRTGAALTHLHLGLIHEQRAEYRDAGRHALTAHDLYAQVGDPTGQALALNCLGWAHACLHEYAAALEFCERALQPLQEAGDRDSEAGTWDSIGFAQHHLGRRRPGPRELPACPGPGPARRECAPAGRNPHPPRRHRAGHRPSERRPARPAASTGHLRAAEPPQGRLGTRTTDRARAAGSTRARPIRAGSTRAQPSVNAGRIVPESCLSSGRLLEDLAAAERPRSRPLPVVSQSRNPRAISRTATTCLS